MGLDLSHGQYSSAYSTFNEMRRWVSKLAGFDLDEYFEYYLDNEKEKRIATGRVLPTKSLKDDLVLLADDLYVLVDHSDCEGKINPNDCNRLAKRISGLIALPEAQVGGYHLQKAIDFVESLEDAFNQNEILEFL